MLKQYLFLSCHKVFIGTFILLAGSFSVGQLFGATSGDRLFPESLPVLEWTQFDAAGFSQPVSGLIYDSAHPTCCGVALGGLGTGSLDIETSGVLGFCSMFQAPLRYVPSLLCTKRTPQILLPFLGLSMGGRTWVLSTPKYLAGGTIQGCSEPGNALERKFKDDPNALALWASKVSPVTGVQPADEILYWGHYPVADIEYRTSSPVQAALRAWSPFIPGDMDASNIPGAVFEVHLHNPTDKVQQGTLAFSFPGTGPTETAYASFTRKEMTQPMPALSVSSGGGEIGYVLAVPDPSKVRFGAALSTSPDAWSKIAKALPVADNAHSGASLSLDFTLEAGQSDVVRIILAWYSPDWTGGIYEHITGFDAAWPLGPWKIPDRDLKTGRHYRARYAGRYQNALEAANDLAANHETLLRRVLAWQQAIYTDQQLPLWLRDTLVNNLNLFAKTSVWALPQLELGDWSYPYGPFGLNESPRSCSIIGCIASNWYGDLPVTYFFPELERMILRNYKAYQRADGAIPFLYPTSDWTRPAYEWQVGLNSVCFADLVDRLWMRTGDAQILREFYPAVKMTTTFIMTYLPGPEGIISIPRDGAGQLWWEHTPTYGMVTQYGGMHLAMLRIVERLAQQVGDEPYARQCRQWFEQGSGMLEEKLWGKDNYLLYLDPKSGKQSDLIMASQLDGEWTARAHGLPGVFRSDRVPAVLDTIKKTCVTPYGFVGFASFEEGAQLGGYGSFSAENHIVAMTYMYTGQKDFGLEQVRAFMDNVVRRQRHPWDLPNMITCDTGERFFGTDYFQNMMLWAVPAAIEGQDIKDFCSPGGLVDKMIKAAQAE